MRILIVSPTYPPNDVPCGIGDFTAALVPRLLDRGLSVVIAVSRRYRGVTDGAATVVPVAERWDRRAVASLVALATRDRYDVVNLQYTPELFGRAPWMKGLPAWLALARGPRLVLTPHTLVGGYRSATWLLPAMLAPARRIIAPSPEVARLIERRLPVFASRVREIPIGSNIPETQEPRETVRARVRAALALAADALVLAHFGFAYPGKGIETLLGAARRLVDRGLRFTLVMIGGAWPGAEDYYDRLQAASRAAGLAEIVRWQGHVPPADVGTLLAASDLYVLPYDDGMSARRGTLLAGVRQGIPIISTRPGVPDPRFRDGENVVLVPPRDEAALADAVARLAAAPMLRASLAAGAAKLAPEFSWSSIADATLAVYREAAA